MTRLKISIWRRQPVNHLQAWPIARIGTWKDQGQIQQEASAGFESGTAG